MVQAQYLESLFVNPWTTLLKKKEAVLSTLSTEGGKALLEYFDEVHTALLKVLVYSKVDETAALRDQFLKGKLVLLEELVEIPKRFQEIIVREAKEGKGA